MSSLAHLATRKKQGKKRKAVSIMISDSLQPIPQRQCTRCNQLFPATLEYFYSSKGNKSARDGLYSQCKTCVSDARRKRPKVPEGYKFCPRCSQNYPATLEYFGACKTRHDGLVGYCKPCAHERRLARYAYAKERGPKSHPPEQMLCSSCKKTKPATTKFFPMNPQSHYGLSTTCRTCINARTAMRRIQHLERERQKQKAYYPSRISYFKHRYQSRRKSILAQQRAFKEQYPEIVKTWKQRYAETPKGKATHCITQHKRRARKASIAGTHTSEQIQDLLKRQKYKCYYCSVKFKKEGKKYIYHIEHTFPLSRVAGTDIPANSIDYIVLACPPCNQSKHNKFPWEWPEGGRLL